MMKAAIFHKPGDIRIEEVDNPTLQSGDEVIVKVLYSCICGSDLWSWRGENDRQSGTRIGHECMGYVEQVGDNITKINVGDLVIAPFSICDGTCQECKTGMTSACRNRQMWGSDGIDGCQGEMIRVPQAEATLTVVPDKNIPEDMMIALLALTDVLCTGHHAAVSAGVDAQKTVAVIGDGAVGLCAVAASKRLGATKIILISTHADRAAIGTQFGATDIVSARGKDAVKAVKQLTNDLGVDCMLECVGTAQSWTDSFAMTRPGGKIGYVGVPHAPDLPLKDMFSKNIGVAGGMAPAAHYIPQLMPDVLAGKLDVSAIFTQTITLDDIATGYKAMDERKAIKTLIKL